MNSTVSGADGNYSVGILPADKYAVFFDPTCANTQTSAYAAQYYDNAPDCAAVIGSPSNEITLASGGSASNINDTLTLQSVISGTVTGSGCPRQWRHLRLRRRLSRVPRRLRHHRPKRQLRHR